MVRINRLLEAMRAQSKPEVMRLAACADDGYGCTRPDVGGKCGAPAGQRCRAKQISVCVLLDAVAGDDYPQKAIAMVRELAAR